MKKLIFLAMAMLLLCGCKPPVLSTGAASAPAQADLPVQAQTTLAVAWNEGCYNPYLSDDVLTRQNAGLLFTNLVDITPDMDLAYRIAQTVDNAGGGGKVRIQIRGGCHFADGLSVTAADAAASLQAARTSAAYGARFANVTDISVEGEAVVVTLAQPDSLFAYLLDIPVMKADETAAVQPTASGRYTYGSRPDALVRTPWAPFPEEGGPAAIALEAIPTSDALISGFARGTIHLYVDGYGSARATSINASESYFRRNSLIFLGVNAHSGNPLCTSAAGRSLLSSLTDRSALVSRAYYGQGYAATGALNPLYPSVKSRQVIQPGQVLAGAADAMAALGYTWHEADRLYKDARGRPAAVDILSYSGNAGRHAAAHQLAEQWRTAGVQVTVTGVETFDNYLLAVQSGEFELYIGEIKLYNNMDQAPFFSGSASVGLDMGPALADAWAALRANAGTAGEYEAAFAQQMPYIPLLWHSGTVVTARWLSGLLASPSGPFYDLSGLHIGE